MNNAYTTWTAPSSSTYKVHVTYTNSSSSSSANTVYAYDLEHAQDALNKAIDEYLQQKIDVNWALWNTILNPDTIHKTSIPQQAEEALMDYVYELDVDFIEDMRKGFCSFDSHLQEKAYDLAEQELQKALDDDFEIGKSTTRDQLIEAIVQSIDFSRCYEIIDEILQAPCTFEQHLRDIGMSTRDFL